MDEIKQMLRALMERAEENSAKLENLEQLVNKLWEEQKKQGEELRRQGEELKKQAKLMESLALRFFEHDAEIRELKRAK
ncbi:hypothetical protein BSNK01_17670 [Bacillaceae bacterium]